MIKIKFSSFEWDHGNWPKCGKHGVTKTQIEYVFLNNPMVMHDPHTEETRLRAIGTTKCGRYVFLAFMLRNKNGENKIRPISARFMHKKEIEYYETQLKKNATA